MYNKNKNGIVGIIIVIVILIVVVVISNIKINDISYAQNTFNVFIMPIQNGLTYLKNWITGNNDFFTDISNLKEENKELKEKNSSLEQSLRELEILKSENETLKEYVNLKDKYSEYTTVPGYVINKDVSNYNNTIVINIGSKDGVEVDMTVISEKGLVGHVISVTESTAKVQTIIDISSSVSCTIKTSKDTIVAKGTLEDDVSLKATYIPTDATVLEGDTIETSGLGGIYPKGILVGTIKEVVNTKNITDRYAKIETAVDFDKLDTVLVIIN
jgi:rod shape-determining protein MreC